MQLSVLLSLLILFTTSALAQYTPDWASLDKRPLPTWYDEAKIGIFIHWGVFSSPGFGDSESAFLWYSWKQGDKVVLDFLKNNYPPDFTYADFAAEFKAEFYDPNEWANIFEASGAKYIVLTSKHHEGFTNWPSSVSWNWNSKDVGPNRDLVGDLAHAIRTKTDIHFGLYHSMFEWFNPLYLEDRSLGYKTQKFVKAKTMPELYEIINAYKPDVLWSDGDWEAPDTYWNSTSFLAWLYNDSPVNNSVVTNDRWGSGIPCHHGGFYTCQDKYNPKVLQKHKWENCMTLDRYSWGYRRNLRSNDVLSMDELTQLLAETISCGGNILINVGPTGYGKIPVIFEERLRQLGAWLGINGEAVYASKPWLHQNDTITPDIWYTSKKSASGTSVYAFVLNWPKTGVLTLGAPNPTADTSASLLGYSKPIAWKSRSGGGIDVIMPDVSVNELPCQWAWTIRLDNLI